MSHYETIILTLRSMEIAMTETKSAILTELADLKAKADAYTTDQGNKIAAAVAKARAAQQADDKAASDAEMAEALKMIEDIGNGLVTFSPSAN